jgi:hypothetical protein
MPIIPRNYSRAPSAMISSPNSPCRACRHSVVAIAYAGGDLAEHMGHGFHRHQLQPVQQMRPDKYTIGLRRPLKNSLHTLVCSLPRLINGS